MHSSNSLSSFDCYLPDLYFNPLDLTIKSHQLLASKQQATYQGMYVQTIDSHFPAYNSQSDMQKNNVNSLHEYNISSLEDTDPASHSGSDIPEIPPFILDKFVSWKCDDIPMNDARSSIPGSRYTLQGYLLVNKPEIREPTLASHSNPDYQLTHVFSELSNPQDLRPVAEIKPLNPRQTTSDNQAPRIEEMTDDLLIEQQREPSQDQGKKRKLINQYRRERYRIRMQDPEKRKLINQRQRELYHARMQDPEKRRLMNERQRERLQGLKKKAVKSPLASFSDNKTFRSNIAVFDITGPAPTSSRGST